MSFTDPQYSLPRTSTVRPYGVESSDPAIVTHFDGLSPAAENARELNERLQEIAASASMDAAPGLRALKASAVASSRLAEAGPGPSSPSISGKRVFRPVSPVELAEAERKEAELEKIFQLFRHEPATYESIYRAQQQRQYLLAVQRLSASIENPAQFREVFESSSKPLRTMICSMINLAERENIPLTERQEALLLEPSQLLRIVNPVGLNLLQQLEVNLEHGHQLELDGAALGVLRGKAQEQGQPTSRLTDAISLETFSYYLSFIHNQDSVDILRSLYATEGLTVEEFVGRVDTMIEQMDKEHRINFRRNLEALAKGGPEAEAQEGLYPTKLEEIYPGLENHLRDAPLSVAMLGYEYTGLVKEGGLAEALEGMAKSMKAANPEQHTVRLIFPKFSTIGEEKLAKLNPEPVPGFTDSSGAAIPVEKVVMEGVEVFLIDHESFQLEGKKPSIYGPDGDSLNARVAAYCNLATAVLSQMDDVDIMHIHDWHAAGVAIKMKADNPEAWREGRLPASVFTFHNHNRGAAQGRTYMGPYNYNPTVEAMRREGIVGQEENLFVKSLASVDMVTTVSETFGTEAQAPTTGEGVSLVTQTMAKTGRLVGIINGANPDRWNPASDGSLRNWRSMETGEPCPLDYGESSTEHPAGMDLERIVERKALAKRELGLWIQEHMPTGRPPRAEERGPSPHTQPFTFDSSKPIVTYIGRFDSYQKGLDQFDEAIEASLANGAQVIVMGISEDPTATEILDSLEDKYPGGVLFVRDYKGPNGKFFYQQGDSEVGRPGIGSVIRAATDIGMGPSRFEPCGLVQSEAWAFGALFLSSDVGGFADTVKSRQERPLAFTGARFKRNGKGRESLSYVMKDFLTFYQENYTGPKAIEGAALSARLITHARNNSWRTSTAGAPPIQRYLHVYEMARQQRALRGRATATPAARTVPFNLASILGREPVQSDPERTAEDVYLEAYYFSDKSAGELASLYYEVPAGLRNQVPHPFGRDVEASLHETFGSHQTENGIQFTVQAPNAESVELILYSDKEEVIATIPMAKNESGHWEHEAEGLLVGSLYHYRINGETLKIDPFGRQERRSINYRDGAPPLSVTVSGEEHPWSDAAWMAKRAEIGDPLNQPLNICEVHPAVFKRKDAETPLSYRELGPELVEHCRKAGYTHVELMGIQEHPYQPSQGYQITGPFAPNSRFGSMEEFKAMVDYLHQHDIGVILDFVPAHFATNSFGLAEFDGTNLFEDPIAHTEGSAQQKLGWGTHFFDYNDPWVRGYSTSAALYWLKEMHIDALRFDALEGILKASDPEGAKRFLREVNAVAHRECPGAFTIAEDMTCDPATASSFANGGFGFDFTWAAGWRKGMLDFFSEHPEDRIASYESLVETLTSTPYTGLLYISHDEVEEIQQSLVHRFRVDDDPAATAANMRSFMSLMLLSPGKKLNVMGSESGNEHAILELIRNKQGMFDQGVPPEAQQFLFFHELSELYASLPQFHEIVHDGNGTLEWLEKDHGEGQLIAYRRGFAEAEQSFVCLHNVAGDEPVTYTIRLSEKEQEHPPELREILNSDEVRFGGSGATNPEIKIKRDRNGKAISYRVTVPPLSTVIIAETKAVVPDEDAPVGAAE